MDRLHAFLKPKNPTAAARAIKAIRQGLRLLAAHPHIAKPAEDMPAGFRIGTIEFGDGGYAVLYRHDAAQVVILAVRHGREAGF